MTTPPDDTTEGLRERYAEAMEDYDSWDHLIDKVVAVHREAAVQQAAEVEQLRAAKRHLSERISIGQEGWNEISRERDALEREVERLRAELAEPRPTFKAFRLVDGQRMAATQRAEAAEAERDLLRETLAESDVGAQVLAQWEAIAAADADRDRLEVELAEAKRQFSVFRDKALGDLSDVIQDRNEARAERDALKAAIERVQADCEEQLGINKSGQATADQRIFNNGVWAQAKRILNILAALDAPETPGDVPAKPKHIGGRANAEDCPACRPEIDKTVLYPWICSGEPETPGDAETGQRHEPASPIYCRAEHPFGEHNEDTHICQGFPAHPDFGLGHACRCGFKWAARSPGDAETERTDR